MAVTFKLQMSKLSTTTLHTKLSKSIMYNITQFLFLIRHKKCKIEQVLKKLISFQAWYRICLFL